MSNIKYIVASLLILSSNFASAVDYDPDKENSSSTKVVNTVKGSDKGNDSVKGSHHRKRKLPGPVFTTAASPHQHEVKRPWSGSIIRKRKSPEGRNGSPKRTHIEGHGNFVTPERAILRNISNSAKLAHKTTPVSLSIAELSPVRRKLLRKGMSKKGTRKSVPKSVMESIFDKHLPDYPFVLHEGEKVYMNMPLFNFDHTFMSYQDGKAVWETNRERMSRGLAPICYRAYIKPEERIGMTEAEIEARQSGWSIELHHLTLDMQGYGILMLTRGLHMGGEASYLVNFDGKEISIERSRLTKEDKESIKVKKGCKIVSNVLHPANGKSKIDRNEFDAWRGNFWAALGNGSIEVPKLDNPTDKHFSINPLTPEHQRVEARYSASMNTRGGVVHKLDFGADHF